jgi:hypothetical protein
MTVWFVHGGCLVAERGEMTVAESGAGGGLRWTASSPHFSEAIMKAILSLGLVLGLYSLGGAADKADPVGTWKCEYKIGDKTLSAELTIKKDGDKLVGTMSWPDQKDEKLKDVKLKDDTLTFSNVRKYMEKEFPLDYTLKIDGDKFKGKAASEFGGKKQEFDIEGKREKKDK